MTTSNLPYATLVFHEIYDGQHSKTSVTYSEEETLSVLKEFLFDQTTRKLKVLDEVNFPVDVTLDSVSTLSAYELAELNNDNEDRSQGLYSVNGSIGNKVIPYCN